MPNVAKGSSVKRGTGELVEDDDDDNIRDLIISVRYRWLVPSNGSINKTEKKAEKI